jgi:hypothetical protein
VNGAQHVVKIIWFDHSSNVIDPVVFVQFEECSGPKIPAWQDIYFCSIVPVVA